MTMADGVHVHMLSRTAKVLLWCLATIDKLTCDGLVKGLPPRLLSDTGRTDAEAMIASGFRPTVAEINGVMSYLNNGGFDDWADMVWRGPASPERN